MAKRRRVKKNRWFRKIAMIGIGYFTARCLEEYQEIDDINSIIKQARQGAQVNSNESNDKTGPCAPCEICTVKMELITKILNDAEIPHVDDEGTVLDTFDRISIHMSMNGKSEEEELN